MSEHIVEILADGRCYRLDIPRKALFRERDKRVRLTRQQWDLLRFFVERPQHSLFTKNELVENVWAKNAAVTDDAVSLAVKSLRRVLDDRDGQFIQTEHGQGYRFTADVKHLSGEQALAQDTHRPIADEASEIEGAIFESKTPRRLQPSVSAIRYVDDLIVSFLTPVLESAVLQRDHDLIAALISRGADINTRDVSYDSLAFLLVCECESEEMEAVEVTMRTLYRSGYDPNLKDIHGMNILFETAYLDYRMPLTAISIDMGATVDHRDKERATPLMQASRFLESGNARILLAAGANPNLIDDEGNTPAICAIDNMRWAGPSENPDLQIEIIEFLELLEEYGAVLDSAMIGARDAIAIATEYEYSDILKFLTERRQN
jgi:DNA-binding winged helix-turn-helix (wHTH) protein